MSTLASSPTSLPSWKQEVNRRLAEHKNRKGISVVEQDANDDAQIPVNSRAAAAARVAARYAAVPSYGELQAAEARNAVRAAEVATRAALEAQAAAQAVLDHLENSGNKLVDVDYESATIETPVQDRHPKTSAAPLRAGEEETAGLQIRWEPDMPVRSTQPESRRAISDAWDAIASSQQALDGGPAYQSVEAAQPIPANLIEFPREIVATRRMRPRITEVNPESSDSQQLSIFEVEPNSISTDPVTPSAAMAADPTWIGTSWQEIELDDQSQHLPDYYAIVPENATKLYQAPFGRRMMATMVDTALIIAIICGIGYVIASRFDQLPSLRVTEICAGGAILGFAALYEWFFLTFAKVTPGMRYAQLSLCTFDEQVPSVAQMNGRLKAMLISVLPVGLGMVWSIFDEDQMSWHDRLSKTYLRLS